MNHLVNNLDSIEENQEYDLDIDSDKISAEILKRAVVRSCDRAKIF